MLNIFNCHWYIYLCTKLQNDNQIVSDYFPGFHNGVKIFSESNTLEVIGFLRFFQVWTLNISFSGVQRLNAQHGNSLFYNLFTFVQTDMYILEKTIKKQFVSRTFFTFISLSSDVRSFTSSLQLSMLLVNSLWGISWGMVISPLTYIYMIVCIYTFTYIHIHIIYIYIYIYTYIYIYI